MYLEPVGILIETAIPLIAAELLYEVKRRKGISPMARTEGADITFALYGMDVESDRMRAEQARDSSALFPAA
jgi:hypothetical protein